MDMDDPTKPVELCDVAKQAQAEKVIKIFKKALLASLEADAGPRETFAAGAMLIAVTSMSSKVSKEYVDKEFPMVHDKARHALKGLLEDAPEALRKAIGLTKVEDEPSTN